MACGRANVGESGYPYASTVIWEIIFGITHAYHGDDDYDDLKGFVATER